MDKFPEDGAKIEMNHHVWTCMWAEVLVKGKNIPGDATDMGDTVTVTWAESDEVIYEGRASFRRACGKNKSALS